MNITYRGILYTVRTEADIIALVARIERLAA